MTHSSDGSRIYRTTANAPRSESDSSAAIETASPEQGAEAVIWPHRSSAARASDWFVMQPTAASSGIAGATWEGSEQRL